jgi:hypothetical protein
MGCSSALHSDTQCRQDYWNGALRYTRFMIRLGNSARFTSHEIDEFRQVGLDMGNVTQHKDIEQEVSRWALTLPMNALIYLRRLLRRWRSRRE